MLLLRWGLECKVRCFWIHAWRWRYLCSWDHGIMDGKIDELLASQQEARLFGTIDSVGQITALHVLDLVPYFLL